MNRTSPLEADQLTSIFHSALGIISTVTPVNPLVYVARNSNGHALVPVMKHSRLWPLMMGITMFFHSRWLFLSSFTVGTWVRLIPSCDIWFPPIIESISVLDVGWANCALSFDPVLTIWGSDTKLELSINNEVRNNLQQNLSSWILLCILIIICLKA